MMCDIHQKEVLTAIADKELRVQIEDWYQAIEEVVLSGINHVIMVLETCDRQARQTRLIHDGWILCMQTL